MPSMKTTSNNPNSYKFASIHNTSMNNMHRSIKKRRNCRHAAALVVTGGCLLFLTSAAQVVEGYISIPTSIEDFVDGRQETTQCIGLQANFGKLQDIQTEDLDKIQNPQGNRMFSITHQAKITRADSTEVLADRVRLQETIEDVPIRGAGAVVSFKGCPSGICPIEVDSLNGKTFSDIDVADGYATNVTDAEVVEELMRIFDATEEGVGALSLEVFAAVSGDHLAFFTDVLVEKEDYMRYFNVIIDAHTLSILSICNLVGLPVQQQQPEQEQFIVSETGGGKKKPPKRYLRNENEDPPVSANGISCGSCAGDSGGVTWSTEYSNCPINSLYLNDEGRETTCLVGTSEDGQSVFGAGPVPSLHWEGTQDCKSTTDQCQTTVLPECSDAVSDVQYVGIKTLEYFQQHLGVMGGLEESSADPVPIKANVHYNKRYCNAFYRYSANTVFFGDCDCSFWTPLTSIDIIAHEIAHGVTKHSSGLEYQYQSGGMNEAFSDIVGTVLEFMIDDSIDQPDFTIGEMLGNKLRNMEIPDEKGTQIASVCDYQSNLDVHHTSGPLNKAYVSAVRQCELSGCTDLKGCVTLIGTIFMYANIQSLTTYSGYLDGAKATCSIVDEYYAAKSPTTTCSADYITTFIKQGWSAVNVTLDDTCQATNCCDGDCPEVQSVPQGPSPNPTAGPPTTLPPTAAPVLAPPTPSPTIDTELEGEENIILRIWKYLQGLFNSAVGVFGGRTPKGSGD